MTSIIKVNTFQDAGGNALFSSDGSGNVTLSSADMKMTPAFRASLSSTQSISSDTDTLVQLDSEQIDTDSCYDTSTYKFTPNVSGKYYFYIQLFTDFTTTQFGGSTIYLRKNGSTVARDDANYGSSDYWGSRRLSFIVDANGSTDYFQVYVRQGGGVGNQIYSNGTAWTYWQGYRIIGA